MKFLFDQSTDRRLALYLKNLGHDVTVVAVDYPPSLPDEQVLSIAQTEQRVLATEDRDFGEIIFRWHRQHAAVLYLRLPPMELALKIARLELVLDRYAGRLDQFIVVTARNERVRTNT